MKVIFMRTREQDISDVETGFDIYLENLSKSVQTISLPLTFYFPTQTRPVGGYAIFIFYVPSKSGF